MQIYLNFLIAILSISIIIDFLLSFIYFQIFLEIVDL